MSEPIGWNVYCGTTFHEFAPNEPELGTVASEFADWVEGYVAAKAACAAVLFPLPPRVPPPGFPVHPLDVVHFGPVHGPAPALCARDPHPESPWHWDGRSTWWQS